MAALASNPSALEVEAGGADILPLGYIASWRPVWVLLDPISTIKSNDFLAKERNSWR